MKILISGINGFVGQYLVEFIKAQAPAVIIHGTVLPSEAPRPYFIAHPEVKLWPCNLTDMPVVDSIISTVRPDRIFHLAGQSAVMESWQNPKSTFENNLFGQLNLFEAIRHCAGNYRPIIQIAGSSEEYGFLTKEETPVTENHELRPMSPYAVSKVAQDMLGYQYFRSYGLQVIRTRAFNHSGPRRPASFVDSSFARQVALIEAGLQEPSIEVGNLEAVRDFTDVRDVVGAYWLATELCTPGEAYNICSGRGYRIGDVLSAVIGFSKRSDIEVRQDQNRMRPSDVPVVIGDHTRFTKATGWEPSRPYLEQTLYDMLEYWRSHVKKVGKK